MKSMRQLQEEALSKARFDGGYPKPVLMPIGIIALARNEEEYKRLTERSRKEHKIMFWCLLVFVALAPVALIWAMV